MATPGLSRLILAGLVTVAAFAASASAADKVGEAVKITVRITGQAGALATGDAIHRDERLRSDASGVGAFLFEDGTKLAVGPNSSVVIDNYVYGGGNTVKKLTLGATKGTLRWISGKSGHQAYKIQTPSGTLGVRGTAFDVYVGANGRSSLSVVNNSLTRFLCHETLYQRPIEQPANRKAADQGHAHEDTTDEQILTQRCMQPKEREHDDLGQHRKAIANHNVGDGLNEGHPARLHHAESFDFGSRATLRSS